MSDNRTESPPPTTPETETPPVSEPTEPSVLGVQPEPETPASEPFDAEKLTLPEGMEKNEAFTKFSEFAASKNLPLDVAQELINMYGAEMKSRLDSVYNYWPEQNQKWISEVQADSELGGDKLSNVKQTVSRVLDNPDLSDPGFRAALDLSGMGSNPAVVRTLFRWASRLTEGGAVQGEPPRRNADGKLADERPAPAQSLYGPDGPHTGGPRLS